MSETLNLKMIGRFGNQCFQFLAAKAIAERDGLELRTPRWVGEKIFQIELTADPDYSQRSTSGYFQSQEAAIYTRTQVRQWFKFQVWVDDEMERFVSTSAILCHRRIGDYVGVYNYPVISKTAYENAIEEFGFDKDWPPQFITEEYPNIVEAFTGDLAFVPDFYMMCKCPILFRGNSCFSWMAGAINTGRVFSPIVKHLVGGVEHDDVEFVESLHPAISDRGDCTDIHLKE